MSTKRHRYSHRTTNQNQKRNWRAYNEQLKRRGDISIWISNDVVDGWYETERFYDGTGAPNLYSDLAILVTHEIRQVFKLPLRQCEGFVNSLFKLMQLALKSPSYSVMSKRLKQLNIPRPTYRASHPDFSQTKSIAIDSTGLQCFEYDSWFEEKYGKNRVKKNWRKLHICVDDSGVIQTAMLTTRRKQDCSTVKDLTTPLNNKVNHITADSAYDNNPNYKTLATHFPYADIVIPPKANARYSKQNQQHRNRNIDEINCYGKSKWKAERNYHMRNQAELAFSRYKRILGGKLHARDFARQQTEAMIGCCILNKMNLLNTIEICKKS